MAGAGELVLRPVERALFHRQPGLASSLGRRGGLARARARRHRDRLRPEPLRPQGGAVRVVLLRPGRALENDGSSARSGS